ncbi:DUF4180 domain-containing protein [Streptomyces ochraceiscleroticus]|uniref:DUF4180 domain-containing protein n=1 Tax=Streptomyces ochraceiscleroticus TaxID=47761 RepID=A0ABW1MI99_9ACTN|nr:DUF4180 domain-containing protein [Streptomyces ochraceiscleroticus]
MSTLQTIHDVPVLIYSPENGVSENSASENGASEDGQVIADERDVLDIIGNASYQGAQWVVIPAERLDERFFQLRTRVAGEIVQKFVNYRTGLVVLGDISRHTEASSALQDFVRECNRGRQTWFLTDLDELHQRMKNGKS